MQRISIVSVLKKGRSPHGERGLKFKKNGGIVNDTLSLSSRRAWIEMHSFEVYPVGAFGRSPHGERGLKCGTCGIAEIE